MLPFETLRLRAEADVATRIEDSDKPQSRRSSWAPPLVLTGELLEICIKLELLAAEDKPIARLWGRFADPKKVGRTLREANNDHDHAMVGIACRGFDLHAGAERGNRSTILFEAQRTADGNWRTGPRWIKPRHDPFGKVKSARWSAEHAQYFVDSYNDPRNPDPDKPAPHPIFWDRPLRYFTNDLEYKQRLLAAAEAEEQERYQKALNRYALRHRATELAAARVAEFAGDQDVQMRFAGRLCGHCCECGRTLTDPKSLEIGIGPECVQHVYWKRPEGGFVRMLDAIADGRIAAVNGELRWVAS
jgi:Family of unknown function (DUF6011)